MGNDKNTVLVSFFNMVHRLVSILFSQMTVLTIFFPSMPWSLSTHPVSWFCSIPLFHPQTLTWISSLSVPSSSPGPHVFLGYLWRKSFQGGDGRLGPKFYLLEDAIKPKLQLEHSSRNNNLPMRFFIYFKLKNVLFLSSISIHHWKWTLTSISFTLGVWTEPSTALRSSRMLTMRYQSLSFTIFLWVSYSAFLPSPSSSTSLAMALSSNAWHWSRAEWRRHSLSLVSSWEERGGTDTRLLSAAGTSEVKLSFFLYRRKQRRQRGEEMALDVSCDPTK